MILVCPECLRLFKLTKDGRLVRHGFKREGGAIERRFNGINTRGDFEWREIKNGRR